jgi:predicted kinase
MNDTVERARVIAIAGPPCAGKSAVAEALGRAVGGTRLDVDDIRLAILPESDQREAHRDIAYAAMHLTARYLLTAGVSPVIVCATYTRSSARAALLKAVAGLAVDVFVVQCRVDAETAGRRFAGRPPGHAAVDLSVEAVVRACTAYPFDEDLPIVDTGHGIGDVVTAVQPLLAGAPPALRAWVESAAARPATDHR